MKKAQKPVKTTPAQTHLQQALFYDAPPKPTSKQEELKQKIYETKGTIQAKYEPQFNALTHNW